jgi:hypothetical protein
LRQFLARFRSPAVTAVLLLALGTLAASRSFAETQMRFCDPFWARDPGVAGQAFAEDTLIPRWRRESGLGVLDRIAPASVATARATGAPSAIWTEMLPLGLGSNASNMIIDKPRNRLVLMGQADYPTYVNHVWERPLDGSAAWSRLPLEGPFPPAMVAGTSIYDPIRERLVAFGGLFDTGVWALPLAGPYVWTELAPQGAGPGTRDGVTAVYDPDGDRMIVFGGTSSQVGFANDVWAFALGDASGWTQLAPAGVPPSSRSNYAAVYDAARHRVLYYSGVDFWHNYPLPPTQPDLWSLTLGDQPAWTKLPTAGETPPGLYQAAAAFDPAHDRMVVFDGVQWDYGVKDSCWVLQLGDTPTWSRFSPPVHPVPRNSSCMVYDAERDQFIMFGGGISDTWSLKLDPAPAWTLLEQDQSTRPYGRYYTSAVYDSSRHRALLFGGHSQYFVHGTVQPGEYNDLWGFTYDRLLRFGQDLRDVVPPPVGGPSIVLDPVTDRLIAYGGFALRDQLYGSAWQLTLAGTDGWTRIYALGALPPARYLHAAVLDPVRRQVIVFGGRIAGYPDGYPLGDTWFLNLDGRGRWTRYDSTAAAPAARLGPCAAYDPVGDRILLFGGFDEVTGTTYNDTWQLSLADPPKWSRLDLPSSPTARTVASMVYDSRRERLVLFGGRGSDGLPLHDTWVLPLADGAGWIPADTSGALPLGRWGAGSFYDPERDRVVVFMGTNDPCSYEYTQLGDFWEMRSDDPAPALLAFSGADAHPGHVALTWRVSAGNALAGTIQRRSETGGWTMLGHAACSASGELRFEDAAAMPGERYAYRVTASTGATARTTDAVWVDVPGLRFALARAANPAARGLSVDLSLPDGGPARLDVLDIAGRRVISRAVGELGAGDHSVVLAAPGALTPGMYVLRLTRGGDVRVARVAVIR